MTPKALSREIKFRMWSIKDKFMDDTPIVYKGAPCTIDTEGKVVWMPQDDTVLMQFTGLLDKNGKEIYEGDIVADRSHTDLIFAIEYDNEHAGYYMPEAFEEECRWPISEVELEIIGNIYESPELIN